MNNILPLNHEIGEATKNYIDTLTKPIGSLGKLEEIAIQLAKVTGCEKPDVTPPGVIIFAADHGVAEEGVSAYPKEVTKQMVLNFVNGGAAINVFSKQIGAIFSIVDIGVDGEVNEPNVRQRKIRNGTQNFLHSQAMSMEEARRAIEIGKEEGKRLIEKGIKCLIVGEMGIGNTTTSSALLSAMTGERMESIVGYGTGISNEQKKVKERVITRAIDVHQPDPKDGFDLLSKLGGLEIAGMVGAMFAAAENNIPILIDGFITTVAACVAKLIDPAVCDYIFATHRSLEPGHEAALRFLEKEPLLQLNLRLGEGSGAAVCFPLFLSATLMVHEMATFTEAGVSNKG
ncbi:nicotinate-nucleotide--dimethylbenzimidazole phosphoribosyltransferase [Bacillus sp. FJAT-47783]|uniref:nicotinate-nucleotide--dimethylbenzimidazole phosphoribosyltransferase n=1 Tax=Bacillus sp. FJAT-47783 TaxID=2922712 RepID=UPI001FADF069|nr:nicotinate-nucleotide--dimethylbenzimidazole phosphoribosyltransferase [Bacillus sp. FJAT-47783]